MALACGGTELKERRDQGFIPSLMSKSLLQQPEYAPIAGTSQLPRPSRPPGDLPSCHLQPFQGHGQHHHTEVRVRILPRPCIQPNSQPLPTAATTRLVKAHHLIKCSPPPTALSSQ